MGGVVEDLAQAERSVVGSLIIAPDTTFTAADSLSSTDFADPVCSRIFAVAARLREGSYPVDEVTLTVAVARGGDLRAAREVCRLVAEAPSPALAGYYAAHVLASSVRRQVLAAGQRLAGAHTNQAEDLLELARRERAQIDAGLQRWRRARPSFARGSLSLPAETRLPLRTPNRSERVVGELGQHLVERVTVGTLLLAPERLREVDGWLAAGDFADPLCAATYRVLAELSARGLPTDPLAVLAELGRGQVRGVDAVALFRLIESVPVPAALDAYGRLVVEAAMVRTTSACGGRVVQTGCRGGDPGELFAEALAHTDPLTQLPVRWQRSHPPGPTRLANLLPLTVAQLGAARAQQPLGRAIEERERSLGR